MKKQLIIGFSLLFLSVAFLGCSRDFLGGAGVGVLGTGAAYEISAKRQLDRLEEDYRAGRISQQEYQIRKDQIRKGSVIY